MAKQVSAWQSLCTRYDEVSKPNNLIIFGCRHVNWYSEYNLDVKTEIVEKIYGNNHFFSYTRPEYINKIVKNTRKFDSIINGQKYIAANTWSESFDILDKLHKYYEFDKLIVFFTPINNINIYGNEKEIINIYGKILSNNTYGLNSFETKNFYKRLMMIYYMWCQHNLKIIQIVEDPLESDFSKIANASRYSYYNNEKLNYKHFPYIEYGHVYKNERQYSLEKKYDLVFGMTSVMGEGSYRENMINNLTNLEKELLNNNISYKFFFKNNSRTLNNYVSGKDYNDEFIAQSKYTIVIKPYAPDEFSLVRFIEAVDRKCIPLIYKDCNWRNALSHMPGFSEILLKYDLFIDENNLIEKIKNLDYKKIIDEFISCSDYKNMMSRQYYHDELRKHKNDFGNKFIK